jgi:methionyl-tRNA formyltransferase
MTAEHIDRMVRALNPWPGVATTLLGREVKIIETALEPSAVSTQVACAGNSTLDIVTIQEAGKKAVSGAEWARGLRA